MMMMMKLEMIGKGEKFDYIELPLLRNIIILNYFNFRFNVREMIN